MAALVALDHSISGVGRAALLGAFAGRATTRAWLADDGNGFAIDQRAGRRATQIGPLVASDEAAALALVERALAVVEGPVFIDVAQRTSLRCSKPSLRAGFVRQRPFSSGMALATTPLPSLVASPRLFAVAGPEFG